MKQILISEKTVCELLQISSSTLRRLGLSDPTFPKKRQLSTKRVAWIKEELEEWIKNRKPAKDKFIKKES